jgi:hypothetical protein
MNTGVLAKPVAATWTFLNLKLDIRNTCLTPPYYQLSGDGIDEVVVY